MFFDVCAFFLVLLNVVTNLVIPQLFENKKSKKYTKQKIKKAKQKNVKETRGKKR
jgi:hypothetical protein